MNRKEIAFSTFLIAGILTPWHLLSANSDGWFVRIVATGSSESLQDFGTVLGISPTALNGFDEHDLPELPPFSDPYLSVVFEKSSWGANNGDYNSDFRSSNDTSPDSHDWHFVVRSDDPDRDVVLTWESEGPLDRMRLVDAATNVQIYPVLAGRIMSYRFNMNGSNQRQFVWKYRQSGEFFQ